ANYVTGLNKPRDVAGAPDGSAYVTNSGNHRIVRIDPSGAKSDIAGSGQGFGGDGGAVSIGMINLAAPALVLKAPDTLATETVNIVLGQSGEIIFTDTINNRIRQISGTVATCVKTGTITISGNSPAPVLTSLSPNSRLNNSGAFTLRAIGSNF